MIVKKNTIMILLLCTLLTSTGQVLIKYSLDDIHSFMSAIISLPLIFGLVIYALASVLLIVALRNAELSLVYPFISLSFIWVTLFSIFLFHEHVSIINIFGIISIIIGISLIGQGGRR
jgi:multidrug transporter EmrE-like cation transporter